MDKLIDMHELPAGETSQLQVWIVDSLWRNIDDFGSDVSVFTNEQSARKYLKRQIKDYMTDFGIERDNENLAIGNCFADYTTRRLGLLLYQYEKTYNR